MAKTLKAMLVPYIALVSIFFSYSLANNNGSRIISGFTTEIIHRDSPLSPLYDPSLTRAQRLAKAKQRDLFYGRKETAQAPISRGSGAYLIKYSIGSPPKPTVGLLDTGSDLVWTECVPCRTCVRRSVPIIDPGYSNTYNEPSCGSRECTEYEESTSCDVRSDTCGFKVEYGDGSHAEGTVATETFSFDTAAGGRTSFPNIVFGCAHDVFNNGNEGNGNGVVGIGVGRASLLSQLGYDKVAYCLNPDESKSSTLHFGSDAVVSGLGAVSTPMTKNDAFYYLMLEGITVGNVELVFDTPELVPGGNIIIDSGATVTEFPTKFYFDYEAAIVASINQSPVRNYDGWRLCYTQPISLPRITVHFKGADVEWYADNVFTRVDQNHQCLAADPMLVHSFYGNVAQVNYLVGFDVTNNMLSFKHTGC
ncbi:aspartic proteinase CDR1-like [Salvia hispanica]|uniref:aspartic proteinase CDR1-like n=1 Tax=Salvia hispanica TaxID=49212 RepID=UPI002009345D|nr:aspartic proteinase CDR1-like [Salvia hispanica]